MTERDVLIVGSGHNALVAACYLARAGLDVEVVEQDSVLGGAVSTVERFPSVLMDRGSSAHIMVRHTGLVEDLELAKHGLRYIDMDPWGFAPYPDGSAQGAITFWHDVDRTCASIADACGEQDAAAYRRFVDDWLPRNRVVFDFFQSTPTPTALARSMSALARLSRGRTPAMVREFLGSADAVLDAYFTDERLKSALAWMAAQSGPPSHESGTADMVGWLTMMHVIPPGRPIGGSGMLTRALASKLESDGGTVSLGDGVLDISPAGGRRGGTLISGTPSSRTPSGGPRRSGSRPGGARHQVVLRSGREISAVRVLSGAHAWTTADLLAPSFPEAAHRLRTTARSGNGIGMVVRLETDRPPAYASDSDQVAHRAMTLLCDDRRALRRCHGEFLAGLAPSNPAALVMCPTVDDPSLAPTGSHTVTIWGQWHAYELAEESWEDIGEREADKLVDVVEKHAPGFRASIKQRHVQTPIDLESEIGLRNGNVMHLEMTLDQMFSLRPTAEDAGYRIADVAGIYLTGASTHPGGGVFGASGRNAARTILNDIRLPSRTPRALRNLLS